MIGRAFLGLTLLGFLFFPLEHAFPARRQRTFRTGFGTDVLHFLFTGTLTGILTLVLAVPVIVVAGWLTPDALREAVRGQPAAVQLAEGLLVVEVVGYWSHRLMHTVPALWRLHRVHHSSAQMDWLAAAHLHPLDSAIGRALALVPLATLGFSRAAFGAAITVLLFHAIAQHANVRVTLGPFRHVVSGPQYHHWHHADDDGTRNRNFAGLFPWLDRLFGTQHLPRDEWPRTYGIDEAMATGYLGQLWSPFRRRVPGVPAGVVAPPAAVPSGRAPLG